jgi:hypothetical protein
MVLCERNLNQVKGRVFNLRPETGGSVAPIGEARSHELLEDSITSVAAQNELFDNLRQVIGVFTYMNHPQARPIIRQNVQDLQAAADEISLRVQRLANVGDIHREFSVFWYEHVATLTRSWLSDRLNDIAARYTQEENAGTAPPNAAQVKQMLDALFGELNQVKSPL